MYQRQLDFCIFHFSNRCPVMLMSFSISFNLLTVISLKGINNGVFTYSPRIVGCLTLACFYGTAQRSNQNLDILFSI